MIEIWIGIAAVLVAVLALLSFLAKSRKKTDDVANQGRPANAAREVK